jgi:hypothetical protein
MGWDEQDESQTKMLASRMTAAANSSSGLSSLRCTSYRWRTGTSTPGVEDDLAVWVDDNSRCGPEEEGMGVGNRRMDGEVAGVMGSKRAARRISQ